MILTAGSAQSEPCPAGPQQIVCVDFIDLGNVETQFGTKHKCRIVWQTQEEKTNGQRYLVSKQYTASLHEKSNLRHDLEAWRGKPFTEAETKTFDTEQLIGKNAFAGIQHNETPKGTYANVASLMPLPKGMAKLEPLNYTRAKDKANGKPTEHDEPEYDREPGNDEHVDEELGF